MGDESKRRSKGTKMKTVTRDTAANDLHDAAANATNERTKFCVGFLDKQS